MKDGLRIRPVDDLDLLHQRQAHALRAAAVDLAEDRLRVDRPADVLGAGQLDHLDQAELDVDVDDGPVRREGVLHVRVALPGLGVDRVGRPVPPLDGVLDRVVAEQLGQAQRRRRRPTTWPSASRSWSVARPRTAAARTSTSRRTLSQAAWTAPPVT